MVESLAGGLVVGSVCLARSLADSRAVRSFGPVGSLADDLAVGPTCPMGSVADGVAADRVDRPAELVSDGVMRVDLNPDRSAA